MSIIDLLKLPPDAIIRTKDNSAYWRKEYLFWVFLFLIPHQQSQHPDLKKIDHIDLVIIAKSEKNYELSDIKHYG